MKRPLSVWIVQILLLLVCMAILPFLIYWTVLMVHGFWGSTKSPLDLLLFLGAFAIRIGLLGFLVYSVIAIGKRLPKGRMLGLAALIICFGLVGYSKLNSMPPGQGLPKFALNSPAERGGALIGNALIFSGFWILFFRFGFSEKSRKYFLQVNPTIRTATYQEK